MSIRVLQIGCGKMGGALVKAWLDVPGFDFTVITPSISYATAPFDHRVTLHNTPDDVAGKSFDLIIVAVKPHMVRAVMPDYADNLGVGGMVMSMAAGTTFTTLEAIFGPVAIVRSMPNLPVEIGLGLTGLVANSQTTQAHKDLQNKLFAPTGKIQWVATEDMLDRFTVIAGSGPGYVYEFARLFAAASESMGFDAANSTDMVLQTLAGSVALAQHNGLALADMRDNVARPGGSTEAGLEALTKEGQLAKLLQNMLDNAYSRTQDLAKQ